MGLFTKIKSLFIKAKKKITEVSQTLEGFVGDHKEQIVKAMQLADLAYDAFEGRSKMVAVISFFITGINARCGQNFNAEQLGTEATKELEEKFQEVYNKLKA